MPSLEDHDREIDELIKTCMVGLFETSSILYPHSVRHIERWKNYAMRRIIGGILTK